MAQETDELQTKIGVVAVLDALGVSSYRSDQAIKFIKVRDTIIKALTLLKKPWIDQTYGQHHKINEPGIFTFGDTVIFSWEVADPKDIGHAVIIAAEWLRPFIYLGLFNKILFRGAVSVGQYIADDKSNTVIGPAIADAAAWYEEAQWVGVIATPTAQYSVDLLEIAIQSDYLMARYVKYDVPLKQNRTMNMWALAWPFEFWQGKGDRAYTTFSGWLEPDITVSGGYIPKGVENKYENTIKFFDFYGKEYNSSEKRDFSSVTIQELFDSTEKK